MDTRRTGGGFGGGWTAFASPSIAQATSREVGRSAMIFDRFQIIRGRSVADEATMEAYGLWQRVAEGEWAVSVAPVAAGDGGRLAPSWLFRLAFGV
jgi:hypothetical protein